MPQYRQKFWPQIGHLWRYKGWSFGIYCFSGSNVINYISIINYFKRPFLMIRNNSSASKNERYFFIIRPWRSKLLTVNNQEIIIKQQKQRSKYKLNYSYIGLLENTYSSDFTRRSVHCIQMSYVSFNIQRGNNIWYKWHWVMDAFLIGDAWTSLLENGTHNLNGASARVPCWLAKKK